MFYALFYGLGIGILLSSMLGTVFFFLIQNSISNGFRSSLFIAAGVIVSDILLILISYFNAYLLPSGGYAEHLVRLGGGVLLLGMGINYLRKNPNVVTDVPLYSSPWMLASKGFLLNILNPGNYVSWLSISAILINVHQFSILERWWFYAGALGSIFGMEVLFALLAVRIKKYLSQKVLHRIDLALGIVFIVFAVILLWPLAVTILT
jgi:L-lysine exporter family protein LysE/ArgO